jgi:hypothetical protein
MIVTADAYHNPLDGRVFYYNNAKPSGQVAVAPTGVLPIRLNQPGNVAFDSHGVMAVLDHTANRVLLYSDPSALMSALATPQPPAFTTSPASAMVEQMDRAGTRVSLPMPAARSHTGEVTVTSNAPPVFPVGTTTVIFTARDSLGQTATISTTVTVRDTQPPTLVNVPAPITVQQTHSGLTPVAVPLPSAIDRCECAVVTSNAPTLFPVGTTVVTFTATDAAGNRATAATTVTVKRQQACGPDYHENFNEYDVSQDPNGWAEYALHGHRVERKEGFRIGRHGNAIVFQSQHDDRAAEFRKPESAAWHDYEWRGSVRLPHGDAEVSLMVYSELEAGRFYRLKLRKSSGLVLLKGWDTALGDGARTKLKSDVWYTFKIRAQNDKHGTRIRAKVWQADAAEPHDWALDATDRHHAWSAGTIGMMSSEEGVWFDGFRVKARHGEHDADTCD